MVGENTSQKIRLKNIEETINYIFEEKKKNGSMSKKHETVCTTQNYIEHFLILASAITGCVSISAFTSLIDIPIRIKTYTMQLKICAITAGIIKYKSIIKKKKNKHDETILFEKSRLNSIEVLISKALIDSAICHD